MKVREEGEEGRREEEVGRKKHWREREGGKKGTFAWFKRGGRKQGCGSGRGG